MKKWITMLTLIAMMLTLMMPVSAADSDDLVSRLEAYYEKYRYEIEPEDLVYEKIADLRGGELELYEIYDKNDQNVYEPIPRWGLGPYFYYFHDPSRFQVIVLSDEVYEEAINRGYNDLDWDEYLSWPTLQLDDIPYLYNYGVLTDADMDELMQVENDAFSIDKQPDSKLVNALYDYVKDDMDIAKEDLAYEKIWGLYGSYIYRVYDKNNPDVEDAPYTELRGDYYVTFDGPMTLVDVGYGRDDEIHVGDFRGNSKYRDIASMGCKYIKAVYWEDVALPQIDQWWSDTVSNAGNAETEVVYTGSESTPILQVYDPNGKNTDGQQVYDQIIYPVQSAYIVYDNTHGTGRDSLVVWDGFEQKVYNLIDAYNAGVIDHTVLKELTQTYKDCEIYFAGDVDRNGERTVADIMNIKNRIMQGKDAVQSKDYDFLGDLDNDGKVTVADIINLKNIIMNS